MSFIPHLLAGMSNLSGAQLHAHADNLMNQAHSAQLSGQDATGMFNVAHMARQVANAANFSPGLPPQSSPIREHTQPHMIKTQVHTAVSSPGLSGFAPPTATNTVGAQCLSQIG